MIVKPQCPGALSQAGEPTATLPSWQSPCVPVVFPTTPNSHTGPKLECIQIVTRPGKPGTGQILMTLAREKVMATP